MRFGRAAREWYKYLNKQDLPPEEATQEAAEPTKKESALNKKT